MCVRVPFSFFFASSPKIYVAPLTPKIYVTPFSIDLYTFRGGKQRRELLFALSAESILENFILRNFLPDGGEGVQEGLVWEKVVT